MATFAELKQAFMRAHEAGDTKSAQLLANAMQAHMQASAPPPEEPKKPTPGFISAVKSGMQSIAGDVEATKAAFGAEGAEAAAAEHRKKAGEQYQLPEFTDKPWEYVKGLAGQSLPYLAAPLVAGAVAGSAPVAGALGLGAAGATALGLGAAGVASAGQFTGSNISRQLESGTAAKDVNVLGAVATAIPQAIMDTASLKMMPIVGRILEKAGIKASEDQIKKVITDGINRTIVDAGKAYGPEFIKTMGIEGLTEAGQQVLERLQAGLNITDKEARNEYFQSFLGGAVLGGAIGLPGHAIEGMGAKQAAPTAPTAPTAPAETPPTPTAPTGLPDTYAAAVQEAEFLKQQPQTEEVKARLAKLQAYQTRLVSDDIAATKRQPFAEPTSLEDQIQNQSATQGEFREMMDLPTQEAPIAETPEAPEKEMPTVLAADVLDRTGLTKQSGLYKQLLGKDLTNLEDLDAVMQTVERAKTNESLTADTKNALETLATQAFNIYGKQRGLFDVEAPPAKLTPVLKKITAVTAGKDMNNPADVATIREQLTDYANGANRSAKSIQEISDYIDSLPVAPAESTAPVAEEVITAPEAPVVETPAVEEPVAVEEPAAPVEEIAPVDETAPIDETAPPADQAAAFIKKSKAKKAKVPVAETPEAPVETPAVEAPVAGPIFKPSAPPVAPIVASEGKFTIREATERLMAEGNLKRSEAAAHIADIADSAGEVDPADVTRAAQYMSGKTKYREAEVGTKGMPQGKVQGIVDEIRTTWTNAPEIKVVQSISELPADMQEQIIKDKVNPKGTFDPNTGIVYLISDNLKNDVDVAMTLAHEALGHYGLQSLLGDSFNAKMGDIFAKNAAVQKRALVKMAGGLNKETAVEEVLAEMAEEVYNPNAKKDAHKLNALQRVVNWLRQVFASWGYPLKGITDGEIRGIIVNARAAVVSGGRKSGAGRLANNKTRYRVGTDAFNNWFGNSKIINKDGSPKMMYHGTARDIHEFRAKQAGAIFLTEDPKFAEDFTGMSEDYMVAETKQQMPKAEMDKLRKKAQQIADKEKTSFADELHELIRQSLPSNANIIPAYVSAQNPFDYENSEHTDAVIKEVFKNDTWKDIGNNDWVKGIRAGNWKVIESPQVQAAIKALGHDAFHVKEGGRKNLAVYDSSQIKSPFNQGTYGTEEKRILYKTAPLTPEGDAAAALNERMKGISNPREDHAETTTKSMMGVNYFSTRKEGPGWVTRIRQSIADKDAPTTEKLEAKFNNKLIDAIGNVRADLYVAQAQDTAGFVDNMFENGGIGIGEDNLVRTFKAKHGASMKKVFDQLHTFGKKLGSLELAIQVAHNAFIANRANEINISNAGKRQKIAAAEAKGNTKAAKLLEEQIITIRASQAEIDAGLEAIKAYPELKEILQTFTTYKNGLIDFLVVCGRINAETARHWKENAGYVPWTRIEEAVDGLDSDTTGAYKSGIINLSKLPKLDKEGSSKEIGNVFDNMMGFTGWAIKSGLKNRAATAMAEQLDDAKEIKTDTELKLEQKHNKDRIVYTYKNGERTAYLLGSVLDMPTFSTNIEVLGPMMKLFKGIGDFQRSAITHMPAFALSQLIQDGTWRGMLLSGVERPFSLPAKVFGNFAKALRGELSHIEALGITGVYDGMPEHMMERAKIKYGIKQQSAAKSAWGKLEKFSMAADLAVRAAIYEQTIEETKTDARPEGDTQLALHRAKEYINFKRAGLSPTIRTMRHIAPFMNAYIQGMDVLVRTMRGKGVSLQEKRKAQQLFLATGLKLAALSAVYTMMASGDDDYEGLEDYERDKNFIIPGTGIKIPVAPEVGFLFKVIPERTIRYIVSQGTERPQDAETFYKGFRDAFFTAYSSPNMMPQAVKPMVELMVNYSFFTGNPIVGAEMKGREAQFQYNDRTSQLAKLFGYVGISPLKADYFLKAYTGMSGAIALDIMDSISDPNRTEKPLSKLPQISTFMYDATGRGYKSEFYKFRESIDEVTSTVNMFKREGRAEELQEYLTPEKLQLYAMRGVAGKIEETLGKLRKYRNIIANDPDLSSDEKRAKTDEIQKQEKEILLAYNTPKLRAMSKPKE